MCGKPTIVQAPPPVEPVVQCSQCDCWLLVSMVEFRDGDVICERCQENTDE